LRVAELLSLTPSSLDLGANPRVTCQGKGRKERILPLTKGLATALAGWIAANKTPDDHPLFANRIGRRLTRDAIALRLAQHAAAAVPHCPSLANKHVTPHVLRHSCAMRMLLNEVDPITISLWLGHADPSSTNPYIHADMNLKTRALAKADPTPPADTPPAPIADPLLTMLEAL
jgi:integrase